MGEANAFSLSPLLTKPRHAILFLYCGEGVALIENTATGRSDNTDLPYLRGDFISSAVSVPGQRVGDACNASAVLHKNTKTRADKGNLRLFTWTYDARFFAFFCIDSKLLRCA